MDNIAKSPGTRLPHTYIFYIRLLVAGTWLMCMPQDARSREKLFSGNKINKCLWLYILFAYTHIKKKQTKTLVCSFVALVFGMLPVQMFIGKFNNKNIFYGAHSIGMWQVRCTLYNAHCTTHIVHRTYPNSFDSIELNDADPKSARAMA